MEDCEFVEFSYPYVIVSKLTDKIKRKPIQAYADIKENSYWLKFYYIEAILDIKKIFYQEEKEQIVLTAK